MKLHTPNKQPDWESTPRQQRTVWQRVAATTNGMVTPGNIVSCLGLVIVARGAERLYAGAWVTGIALIIIGRLFDVLDGFVADITKTKSRVGEAVDALCDKATVLIILTITLATHTLNPVLLAIVFFHHLYTGIFGAIWGRRYQLHSSQIAKLAMFMSWVAIIFGLAGERYTHNPWVYTIADIVIVMYACFAAAAIIAYHRELRRAMQPAKPGE